MTRLPKTTGLKAVMLCASLVLIVPAIGAPAKFEMRRQNSGGLRSGIGTFTPAAADARLAASLANSGVSNSGFRFTPAMTIGKNRAVTVAVRARTTRAAVSSERIALVTPAKSIAPVAYDLGVGVGWKRFALSGDISRIDQGSLLGSRDAADVGISYNAKKWSTRVQLAADRPRGNVPQSITGGESVAVDVGGSYRLTKNIDLTAGVRYTSERYRLAKPRDDRRDSQAVYVGTAFRF